jgi:hypothetical protein
MDVVSYLSGIHFPFKALSSINLIFSFYDRMPPNFLQRIPLWPLLENPWSIIDPLLETVPG